MTGLLPPNATPLERGLESVTARLSDVPVPLRDLWNPATCPAHLLPWLGWGLSIDFWDASWTEAEKRVAIAGTIERQRRKGTRASLGEVIDRIDPLIRIVEWFEDRDTMDPHTFRLELPLAADSNVVFDETLVRALLRDIAAVKPLRSHMRVVHKLRADAAAYILSGATIAGLRRLDHIVDLAAPADPAWATYLQTEEGEPVRAPDGAFLETA